MVAVARDLKKNFFESNGHGIRLFGTKFDLFTRDTAIVGEFRVVSTRDDVQCIDAEIQRVVKAGNIERVQSIMVHPSVFYALFAQRRINLDLLADAHEDSEKQTVAVERVLIFDQLLTVKTIRAEAFCEHYGEWKRFVPLDSAGKAV